PRQITLQPDNQIGDLGRALWVAPLRWAQNTAQRKWGLLAGASKRAAATTLGTRRFLAGHYASAGARKGWLARQAGAVPALRPVGLSSQTVAWPCSVCLSCGSPPPPLALTTPTPLT